MSTVGRMKNQFGWSEARREIRVKAKTVKFNRRTWNEEHPVHYYVLQYLRRVGFARSCALRRAYEEKFRATYPNKFYMLRSTAFEEAHYKNVKGGVFLDAGAGHSGDCIIAKMEGFKTAYAVDLFPFLSSLGKEFGVVDVKGDIVEKLPIANGTVDVMVCQAVLPLMPPKDRRLFYRRAQKLLKNGGFLSIYFCKLINGYGFDIPTERKAALAAGFGLYRNYGGGFMLQKVNK